MSEKNEILEGTIKNAQRGVDGKLLYAAIMPDGINKLVTFVPLNPKEKNGEEIELAVGTRVRFETFMAPRGPGAKYLEIDNKKILGEQPKE